jgi:hypothetical protein
MVDLFCFFFRARGVDRAPDKSDGEKQQYTMRMVTTLTIRQKSDIRTPIIRLTLGADQPWRQIQPRLAIVSMAIAKAMIKPSPRFQGF